MTKVSWAHSDLNTSLAYSSELIGTIFTPLTISSPDLLTAFLTKLTAPLAQTPELQALVVNTWLQLYPDIPSEGSPFNTGNETFGLSPEWKRGSAIVGDLEFQALRRAWINAAALSGVKTFGYYFTDPQTTPIAPGGESYYLFI